VEETLEHTLDRAKRLIDQIGRRKVLDKCAKLYSWHAPELECQAIEPIIGLLKAEHRKAITI